MRDTNRLPDHDGQPGRYWDAMLHAFAMEDIQGDQKTYIEKHIEGCPMCIAELARIRKFMDKLPDTAVELDDASRDNMLAAIKARLPKGRTDQSPLGGWFWSIFGGAKFKFAYIAVAIIVLAGIVGTSMKIANPRAYQLRVIGGDELIAGGPASLRVLVNDSDMKDPSPVRGVPVSIGLESRDGKKRSLFTGRTDRFGTLDATFRIPDDAVGEYALYVDAKHTNTGRPLSFDITSSKPAGILLSTDKPLYKPDQTVEIRSMLRDTSSGKAIQGRDVTIEIENPGGTKIFRKELVTSDWGIVSSKLHLSDLAETGNYLIRAIAGDDTAEMDFKVDKYVLPKFKITIDTESDYYLPGDTLKGTITAAYHFGKPVSEGDVTIDFSTFDVATNRLHTIREKLDEEGNYEFEYRLPEGGFVGTPFLEGRAELYIDVEVRDTGGQQFSSTKSIKVYPDRLMLRAVPAGGRIVGDMLNVVYILAYRPDHSPVSVENVEIEFKRDTYQAVEVLPGVLRAEIDASVRGLPDDGGTIEIEISGDDPEEGRFNKYVTVDVEAEGLLLLTDATYYGPGDAIKCMLSTPDYVKTAFIDLYADGRTILTKSVKVEDGKAELTLAPPAGANGRVDVRAYAIQRHPVDERSEDPAELWLRDARVVYIETESASGNIDAKFDNEEYVPGADGSLNIKLTDGGGNPVQGALGLKMVDEALYTLAGEEGNLEQLYRTLVKDILEPEFQIKGEEFLKSFKPLIEPAVAVNPEGARAVEAVFAAEMRPVEIAFAVDTSNAKVVPMLAEYARETAWTGIIRLSLILMTILFVIYIISNFVIWRNPSYITLPNEDGAFGHIIGAAIIPFFFLGLLAPVFIICSLVMLGMLFKPELRYASNRAFMSKFGILSLLYLIAGVFGIFLYFINGQHIELTGMSWMSWYLVLMGLFVAVTIFINRLIRPRRVGGRLPIWETIIGVIIIAVLIGIVQSDDLGGFGLNAKRGAWESRSKATLRSPAMNEMAMEGADEDFNKGMMDSLPYLGGGAGGRADADFFAFEAEEMPAGKAMAEPPAPAMMREKKGPEPPRLRRYFPETMLWVPELITDERGQVTYPVTFADSITDWRLDADAITSQGGYATHQMGVRVFQPLFVDMDLPVELRRGDYIELPVVVYNFLDTEQRVRVELKPNNGFEMTGANYEQHIVLGPGEVGAVHYPITAKKVGDIQLEVGAYGSNAADKVLRELTVIPEGIKQEDSQSGRLSKGESRLTFDIPEFAVDDSEVAVFKIHPGVGSQIVEGLENIFQKPYGCFEQTSSVTYPNILALKYMQDTNQVRPEIEATALTHIETGYQRLLSFEVDGGGFDWFGNPPANIILSAYGLMQFKDMSDVTYVDEAVLERTYEWLAAQQESSGAFYSKGGIHEGITGYGSTRGKATAFVGWALRRAGYDDTDTYNDAIRYLDTNYRNLDDNYIRALVLNAIGGNGKYSDTAVKVADDLADDAIIDDDGLVHWETETDTAVYSYGNSADVETTAVAVLGLIETGLHADLIDGAINWLLSRKTPNGTWATTAGTVLSLKALIAAEGSAGRGAVGEIEVILNGKKLETIVLDEKNNDLLLTVDLRPELRRGRNEITVATDIAGLAYQVSYWYNTRGIAADGEIMVVPGFEVVVNYDRTDLESGGKVGVNVSLHNRDSRPAMMVLVDLGLAPGFAPDVYSLDDLVDRGRIMRWERKGNQITIYLDRVNANSTYDFDFEITADFPIRADSGEVKAYRYYEPEDASVKPGVEFTVV